MKTELEKKLDKLPEDILVGNTLFIMFITKHHISDKEIAWHIEYKDETGNAMLIVEHKSLQAAVDSTLASLKKIEYYDTPEGHLMEAIFGYKI